MSQAENLLQSLVTGDYDHDHDVVDNDSLFIINSDTRKIENASGVNNVLMQFDHNSEIFTFELDRYIEGHDMTLCNRVRVHFNNVESSSGSENADVAEIYDLAVSGTDDTKVTFSWMIAQQATQLAGTLNFLIQLECINDEGNSVYEWHTDIYTNVEIRKGRDNGEPIIIEYSNVLEQWYQRIFNALDEIKYSDGYKIGHSYETEDKPKLLSSYQGVENAGKILVVGEDGYITFADMPS